MMKLPSRGWGPWRQEWYTYSSSPRKAAPEDGFGQWRFVWAQAVDSLIYRRLKPVWIWWHNRPNSLTRRRLRKHFPNLR